MGRGSQPTRKRGRSPIGPHGEHHLPWPRKLTIITYDGRGNGKGRSGLIVEFSALFDGIVGESVDGSITTQPSHVGHVCLEITPEMNRRGLLAGWRACRRLLRDAGLGVKRGERRAREEFWEVWELRYRIPPIESTPAQLREWWHEFPCPKPRTYSEMVEILDEKRPLPSGESWSEGTVKEQVRAFRHAVSQRSSGAVKFIRVLEARDSNGAVRLLRLKDREQVIQMHPYWLALRFLMSHNAKIPPLSIAGILKSSFLGSFDARHREVRVEV